MTAPPTLHLRPGRERSLLQGHPWLFSGAVDRVEGEPAAGGTVEVTDSSGRWLARGAYSPRSRIACRIWTFDPEETVDEGLIRGRLEQALDRRRALASDPTLTAYREVHAESDMLPGLTVDRYGEHRVVQLLTPGAEHFRSVLIDALASDGAVAGVFERSEAEARVLEGLEPRRGPLWGTPPGPRTRIDEHGLTFWVDIEGGHKTGFYLDQRDSRRRASQMAAPGEVLDAFCYTGGFSIASLRAGAERVVAIDSSGPALAIGAENVLLNQFDADRVEWIEGDVFHELRRMRDASRQFDTVILDPPRFAATSAQVHRAARGYKDINLLAFKLLRPGGRLITFSCSGGVEARLFEQIVAGAARDAGCHALIEGWLGQPADHPVGLHFPEGRYLKGLVCRKGKANWYPRR